MTPKKHIQTYYAAAIVVCAGLGVIPLQQLLLTFFDFNLPPFHNLYLLQTTLLLGALCLAIYYVTAIRSERVDSFDMLLFHMLVGLLIVGSLLTFSHLWKYLTHQRPDTWSEQLVFLSAALSRGTSDLYSMSHLEQPTFMVSNYPPVYYLAQKLLFVIFGEITLVGRYISVAAIVATAILLTFASRKRDPQFCALAAPLLFISILPGVVIGGGSLARPDFLAGSLSLAGFVVYLKRGLRGEKRWMFGSSLLCGLALLTKPSVFAGFAAIAIQLLWDKRYRECCGFVSLVVMWFLGVYAALWWPTEGGIWLMTISGNAAKLTVAKIMDFGFAEYMTNAFVVLALSASAILLAASKGRRSYETVVSLYFLVALSWFLLSVARPGSSYYYFIESAVSGSLVIGGLLSYYLAANKNESLRLALFVLVVIVVVQVVHQVEDTTRTYDNRGEQAKVTKVLSELKVGQGEYVLSDARYTLDVIQAGHRPLIVENFAYTLMADNGVISIEPLMNELRRGKVPYLVLQNTLDRHSRLQYGARYWPVKVLGYLTDNYSCGAALEGITKPYLIICERAG